ncbi:nucleotidyltransferase domain-containing protein [bacterium]|nr:nucleotidyltransferase domain-containing protein [bacterium]MBU1752741.1 nucleotidyltransferase domain-containing protein [bacterium]
MAQKRDQAIEIVRDFLDILTKKKITLFSAYIYGSYITDSVHPDSDIDVAIVSDALTGNWIEDWEMLCEARRNIDVRIEPIPFRPEEFCDENPLVWEIKHKGLRLR